MSEATSKGLYLIKGKFYGNIVKCQKGTYYSNPILKITFAKGATLNYNPADVTYFPYTRTIEGDFRVKGSSDQYYISSRIHIYGKDQAYGIESKKGFVNYTLCEWFQRLRHQIPCQPKHTWQYPAQGTRPGLWSGSNNLLSSFLFNLKVNQSYRR